MCFIFSFRSLLICCRSSVFYVHTSNYRLDISAQVAQINFNFNMFRNVFCLQDCPRSHFKLDPWSYAPHFLLLRVTQTRTTYSHLLLILLSKHVINQCLLCLPHLVFYCMSLNYCSRFLIGALALSSTHLQYDLHAASKTIFQKEESSFCFRIKFKILTILHIFILLKDMLLPQTTF